MGYHSHWWYDNLAALNVHLRETKCCWGNLFQVVEDGYEFFAKRQLVTLFSAPNYCGEFDNAGGMMSVDESLMCSFQVSLCLSVYHNMMSFVLVLTHECTIFYVPIVPASSFSFAVLYCRNALLAFSSFNFLRLFNFISSFSPMQHSGCYQ